MPFTFNITDNDELFGQPVLSISVMPAACGALIPDLSSPATATIAGTPSTAGTCDLPYLVVTPLGNSQAVVHITIAPA